MTEDNKSKLLAQSTSDPASGKKCHLCKTPNAQDAKYCTQCGDLLGERECKKCKSLNTQEAKYCTQCGNRFQCQTLYDRAGPIARTIKIILQMIVGAILTIFIIFYIAFYVGVFLSTGKSQDQLTDGSILTIVGVALAISTAFELAYTLFTAGPDEAVNPVITGVAAGILLLI